MATPGISAPTDGRLRISDDYLVANAANANAVIDVEKMTPIAAFEFCGDARRDGNNIHFAPRGIHVDYGTVDQADPLGQYAVVNGCLRNESRPMLERLTCGQTHPNRYKFIYPMGTTARGIKIHA
jgi:hypothetical protein